VSKKAIGFSVLVLVLAGIGLFSMFYENPLGTLKKVGVFLVVAGIIYLVYRQVSKSITTNSLEAGYKKALQQQKRKQKGKHNLPFAVNNKEPERLKPKKVNKFKQTTRKNHSFQVIEGKKNKKEQTKTS